MATAGKAGTPASLGGMLVGASRVMLDIPDHIGFLEAGF
jgi:hypothetical protein